MTQGNLFNWFESVPDTVEVARTASNHRVLRKLWENDAPGVRKELLKRDYHYGTGTFLPRFSEKQLWDKVQAVQKGCRVGLLTQQDITIFRDEWIDIRQWLRRHNDKGQVQAYSLALYGRLSIKSGATSTMVLISSFDQIMVKRNKPCTRDEPRRHWIEVWVQHDVNVPAPHYYDVEVQPGAHPWADSTVQYTVSQ